MWRCSPWKTLIFISQMVSNAADWKGLRGAGDLECLHHNMGFWHDNKTSYDDRIKVRLWGVMIQLQSWAKSNICQIFDLAQNSMWIMTPQSITPFLFRCHDSIPPFGANTLGQVCQVVTKKNIARRKQVFKSTLPIVWPSRHRKGAQGWLCML